MWKKQYGDEVTLNILDSVNGRPPMFAVPNFTKTNAGALEKR
jgi:hypothetical protein